MKKINHRGFTQLNPEGSGLKARNSTGFTLIELLIVMAIISIIAAVVFVALDPLRRFRDSRDAARWTDVSALVSAIKIDQVDNGGAYMSAITAMTENTVYMIIDADTAGAGAAVDCANSAITANCDVVPAGATNCVNLSGLVTDGYLGKVPVSPNGTGVWGSFAATKATTDSANQRFSGYTIERSTTGILTVRACEAENTGEIKVSR